MTLSRRVLLLRLDEIVLNFVLFLFLFIMVDSAVA
jgi:hypothetical protein